MNEMLKLFVDVQGYTIKDIAELVERSENYVARKLKEAGVSPEGEKVTAMGPNSGVWKGSTIKRLIKQNVFGNVNVGEIIWYDTSRTRVYLVEFDLYVDGKLIPSYKIGITSKEEIAKGRFKEEISSGLMSNFKVVSDIWFDTRAEAEAYETALFNLVVSKFGGYKLKDGTVRFHNFYTKSQPKGITEMRLSDSKELEFLINEMSSNGVVGS